MLFLPLSPCSSTLEIVVADEDIPDSARKPKESGDEAEEGGAEKPAKKAPAKKRKADAEDGEGANGAKEEEKEKPKKKRAVSISAVLSMLWRIYRAGRLTDTFPPMWKL